MLSRLDRLPMNLLIIWTILMALAPFAPMPHLIEKNMLKEGTLRRPIDIFDLFFHAAPALLLALKLVRNYPR